MQTIKICRYYGQEYVLYWGMYHVSCKQVCGLLLLLLFISYSIKAHQIMPFLAFLPT